MVVVFMLACWVICLASGYIISGDAWLGLIELVVWHFSITIMVQVMDMDPTK